VTGTTTHCTDDCVSDDRLSFLKLLQLTATTSTTPHDNGCIYTQWLKWKIRAGGTVHSSLGPQFAVVGPKLC